MLVHGVEQGFDVHLGFLSVFVEKYLDESAGELLAVEAFGMQGGTIVEGQLGSDLFKRGVYQYILLVEDDDRVDDVLQVSYLMCGDYDGGILGSVFGNG